MSFLFGVLLPLFVLVFELSLRWCSNAFFDPLPTWFHVGMVAFVGLGNLWIILKLKNSDYCGTPRDGLIIGLVVGISLIYGLRFLPLLPAAFMLLFVIGIGILPMAPLCAFLAAVHLTISLWHREAATQRTAALGKVRASITLGMILGALCVFGAELPYTITREAVSKALSEDPLVARKGINTLKNFGSQSELLKLCYYDKPQMSSFGQMLFFNMQPVDPKKARNIFYRVTGIPFNREQFPKELMTSDMNWWRWDSDLGEDAVGARSEDLFLKTSDLNVLCDANSASADMQWTFVFQNKSNSSAEARTNILLPPGAVVSDLTLWINDKPQPAAFGSKSQVRSAYQAVVQRQRDPVLVTSAGGDRVLLQCFPVPPKGEMKTRIRIAAPMLIETGRASLVLPRLVENNFEIAGPMNAAVTSLTPFKPHANQATSLSANAHQSKSLNATAYSATGTIDLNKLGSDVEPLVFERAANVPPTRKVFSVGKETKILTQTIKKVHESPIKNVVVVLDASVAMKPHAEAISEAIGQIADNVPWSVVVAADEVSALTPEDKLYQELTPKVVAQKLTSLRFQGGPDNAIALRAAIELAARSKDTRVLWIHGPQPVLFHNASKAFLFDDASNALTFADATASSTRTRTGLSVKPVVYSFEVESGPNLVAEKLSEFVTFKNVRRFGTVRDDLNKIISQFNHGADLYVPVRTVSARTISGAGSAGDSSHNELIKLWAADQVYDALMKNERDKATKAAVTYRVVTPVSGAVVLETRQQFKDYGLKQGDDPTTKQTGKNGEPVFQEAADVPSVPEPEMWLMIFVVGMLLLMQNRRLKQMVGSRIGGTECGAFKTSRGRRN